MKQLTLPELQTYCSEKKPGSYTYLTSHQTNIHSTLSVLSRYHTIRVFADTNTLLFLGEEGYLCFDFVRSVGVFPAGGGFMIVVICGETQDKEVRYQMIAG